MKPTIRKVGHRWVLTVPMGDGTSHAFTRPSWAACRDLVRSGGRKLRLFAVYEQRFERFWIKPTRVEVGE